MYVCIYIYMYLCIDIYVMYIYIGVYVCVCVCLYMHIYISLHIHICMCIFQAAIVSILLYGCTTWTLSKQLEKRLDGNYTRILRAILNRSWRQHSTKQQLCGHQPPNTKTIQIRRNRHAGHCWRSKDELISNVRLWTPSHGRAKAGRPAQTYIQQVCEDIGRLVF